MGGKVISNQIFLTKKDYLHLLSVLLTNFKKLDEKY